MVDLIINTRTMFVTTTMSFRTMNLHQPEYDISIEGDPFAASYADYEQGFDQWGMWAQENEQRRRRAAPFSRNNRRSLLIESVDPRVESHMRWIPKNSNAESKMEAKRAALPTLKERRRRWLSRGDTNKLTGAGDCEFITPTEHGEQKYKNDESVCSTLPVSESDDSSDGRGPPPAATFNFPASDPIQMSRTMVLEQEAMIRAMELNQQWQEEEGHKELYEEPARRENVTLLPTDRVKRAMERGDSIRMLECSGCCRQLLVTPDFPLVYCADCQCFSNLDVSSS